MRPRSRTELPSDEIGLLLLKYENLNDGFFARGKVMEWHLKTLNYKPKILTQDTSLLGHYEGGHNNHLLNQYEGIFSNHWQILEAGNYAKPD